MSNHPSGLELARRTIGQPRDAVPTPALLVDLPRVKANVQEMARRMASLPAALRPHAKIHKSPILGKMQLEAGAIGLTTATVWEASAMVDAGLTDILIANQVVGPVKAGELGRIARAGDRDVRGRQLRQYHRALAGCRGRQESDRRDRRG